MLGFIVALSMASLGDLEINDGELGFRVRLPDGFERLPEGQQQSGIAHSYSIGQPGTDSQIIVLISGLRGALPREIPLPEISKDGGTFVFDARWKREFDIPVVGTRQQVDGIAMSVMVAQVPLSPRALKVQVAGDSSREDEMRQVMTSVLETLEGPTNWLSNVERKDRFAQATLSLVGLVVAIIAILVWYVRSRPAVSGK